LEQVKTQPKFQELPVIVYTGKDLSPAEQKKTRSYAESVIVKNGPRSPENLLNDTALFLHRVQQTMPRRVRELIEEVSHSSSSLEGKKALIVDDDVRNIFALTSVLENQKMEVLYAENGKAGIDTLSANPDIDIVLMDVMMPEMDGYQTMQAIRADPKHQSLPIIAVTAKALKDDREKCIDAGASDYLPKPVDPDKLVELMRLWAVPRPRPDSGLN
jgi:CheY-like chemotaxis protein